MIPFLDSYIGKGRASSLELIATLPTSQPKQTKCDVISQTEMKCNWKDPDHLPENVTMNFAYKSNMTDQGKQYFIIK